MHRGIFGGSFDPIHNGHLVVAQAAAEALGLDRVHVIPAARQPLKQGEHGASAAHRLAMVRLAVRDHPILCADATEVERGGTSYMVDTLRVITAEYPGDRLSLLIGADAAAALSLWRDVAEVSQLAHIVVVTRPGAAPPSGEVFDLLSVPAVDVSATDIRRRAAGGETLEGLVPASVAQYIATHGLYRTDD
jgi:nicotinate-nucleotide adenylyltransferase